MEDNLINPRHSSEQEALLLAAKMSELGKMVGSIAHEINTPLNTMLLLTESLMMKAEKKNLTEFVDPLKKLESTVQRIASIVKGLRAFSRDGSHDPFQPADVQQMVRQTLMLCGHRFKQESIDIRVSGPAELNIFCRETQICQLLLNLLNNAADAVLEGSEKWVEVSVEDRGRLVALIVSDSGPGIPSEIREQLAIPFFTTKGVGVGTGLGLTISTRIARDHGGDLQLDPATQCTRFIITLAKDPRTAAPLL